MGKVPEYNLRAINTMLNLWNSGNLPKGTKERIKGLTGKRGIEL